MVRTTLALDEDLLRALKEKAARQGVTLQTLTNDLLRESLLRRGKPGFHLQLVGWEAEQQPGVDILDRDKLFELMNGR
ncbi:MAG: hypothetical protein P8020_14395 [Acidobacteriota bacterium]